MVHWINSHGIEVAIGWYTFAAIVGSAPPLPADAGFWARWGYGFLHAASANIKQAAALMNVKIPNGDTQQ